MEELSRVGTGNFEAVRFADGSVIEPVGCEGHILKRVID